MAKKRYTKLEEEIIQILDEADREPGWRKVTRRARLPQRRPSLPQRSPIRQSSFQSSSWLWIGGSFGLALVAIMIADWSRLLAIVLAIASIALFLSPIVLRSRRGGGTPVQTVHTWRGKDIELPPNRSGFVGELRYRFWQMRNRR